MLAPALPGAASSVSCTNDMFIARRQSSSISLRVLHFLPASLTSTPRFLASFLKSCKFKADNSAMALAELSLPVASPCALASVDGLDSTLELALPDAAPSVSSTGDLFVVCPLANSAAFFAGQHIFAAGRLRTAAWPGRFPMARPMHPPDLGCAEADKTMSLRIEVARQFLPHAPAASILEPKWQQANI
jgi:hypothetical protein